MEIRLQKIFLEVRERGRLEENYLATKKYRSCSGSPKKNQLESKINVAGILYQIAKSN